MTIFVQEFLFRGYEPSKGGGGAWHVVLGSEVADGLGGTVVQLRTMSIAQAEAEGHSLPDLIAAINASTLVTAERANAELRSERDARTEMQGRLDEAALTIAGLQAELDALKQVTP